MKALVDFQAKNKLLFMAHNQAAMREMGRLTANPEKHPVAQVIEGYETLLGMMFARLPKRGSHVNVLMHALGYFSDSLKDREKAHFLGTLERYREGILPLSACTSVLRSWVERFNQPYLKQQTYFSPYPEDLIDISDSGKGMGSAREAKG